ncbi:MAG: porin family protein [Bacteroidota bacterium]
MLRTLLLTVALLATTATASAQIIPSFGIAGGLNFGSLSDAGSLDIGSSTGYHIGLYAQVGVASFAVRPGLFYQRVGDIEFPTVQGLGALDEIAVSYVIIPIDLLYKPLPTPLIKPYLLAGPEFRIAAGDLADAAFGNEDSRSFTTALNIGIGAQFGAIIGPKVFGELRYSFDLSGVSEGDETVKVNVVMLRVGLGI